MKVKLWTHNDLDGVGNNVLAKLVYGNDVSITNTDYDQINDQVMEFLDEEIDKYDIIYFTDISIKDGVAQMLDDYCNKTETKVLLFDHHKTATYLNRFDWATVNEGNTDRKNSGTSLFYEYLSTIHTLPSQACFFSELVRKYDTWEWKTKYNDDEPKQLNDLYVIYGINMFVEKMVERLASDVALFTSEDLDALEIERMRITRYVNKKQNTLKEILLGKYTVGIVFAEQYFSDLTITILNNKPRLDFLMIVNVAENGVSYRTMKKDVDVSGIAKLFGGGGHPEASGSPLSSEINAILHMHNIL